MDLQLWKFAMTLHQKVAKQHIRQNYCNTYIKIASLGRQEPQPAGTAKWPTTFRFGKILGTTSVVRSKENP